MRYMDMKHLTSFRVGIVGGGLMGSDLFGFLSDLNMPLAWVIRNDAQCGKAAERHARKLDRLVKNGAVDGSWRDMKRETVRIGSRLDLLLGCDFVIEAITEDAGMKTMLYEEMEQVLGEAAVISSATSSIRPSRLARGLRVATRFAATHFFYPVSLKNIVEVVFHPGASGRTREIVHACMASLGMRHIVLPEEEAFLLNRVLLDYQTEACRLRREKGLSLAARDRAVKRRIHPAGVFEFFDGVGLDTALAAVRSYAGDDDYHAPLIEALTQTVEEGMLGKKSGAGFYTYPREIGEDFFEHDDTGYNELAGYLESVFLNSCFRAMERGICPDDELDRAIGESTGAGTGPLALADEIGRDRVRDILAGEYKRSGLAVFRPSLKL